MSYYPSNLGYIGVASQGVQKTTRAATSKVFIKYLSEDIGSEFTEEVLREGGNYKYNVNSVKTNYKEKVAFSTYAYPKATAYLLGALLGKDTVTGATTSRLHTITIKTTDLATTPMQKWLTFNKNIDGVSTASNSTISSIGCKLNSITLSGAAGKPVTVAVEGTGLTGKIITTVMETATYDTVQPLCFYNGTYNVLTAQLTTSTTVDINSFSVKLTAVNDNALQTVALTNQDIINHRFEVEATVQMNYTNFNLYKKATLANATAGTLTSAMSSYSDGALYINLVASSGMNIKRIGIKVPKLRLKSHMLNHDPSPKTLQQPLSGVAFKQATTELVTVYAQGAMTTTFPF